MRNKADTTARVRAIGFVSSIAAVAAIALTLLADNGSLGFCHSVSLSERVSLLFITVALCVVHILLRLAHRPRAKRAAGNPGR
jgi:hypothetical protein